MPKPTRNDPHLHPDSGDATLREAARDSAIGEAVEPDRDPSPNPTSDAPGMPPVASTSPATAETPPKARKSRQSKPRPVKFLWGESITLNAVEIGLDDFRRIRDFCLDSCEACAGTAQDAVKKFFDCLYLDESGSEEPQSS